MKQDSIWGNGSLATSSVQTLGKGYRFLLFFKVYVCMEEAGEAI